MEYFTKKLYTREGYAKESFLREDQKALDIGCGGRKVPGAVGIDISKDSKADVIHDLGQFPWPFDDNTFDVIVASHFMEHVFDITKTMKEIYRIAKPGARIVMQVPYFRTPDAFCDPEHRNFFTMHTFDFDEFGNLFGKPGYTTYKFKKIGFWFGWPQKSKNPAVNLFKWFIFRYPDFYERYLSLIFPFECLTWELEAVK